VLVNNKSTWKWFDHPSEADVAFRLRPLTDDEYQEALDARFDQVINKAKSMGAELTKSFQSAPSAQAATNKLSELHAATAIRYAVQEWRGYPEECNDENKSYLDKPTQDWLKERIVEMNGPRPTSASLSSNGELKTEQSQENSATLIDSGP
jgi:hypothetical protein